MKWDQWRVREGSGRGVENGSEGWIVETAVKWDQWRVREGSGRGVENGSEGWGVEMDSGDGSKVGPVEGEGGSGERE